jgi:hypothetical protein
MDPRGHAQKVDHCFESRCGAAAFRTVWSASPRSTTKPSWWPACANRLQAEDEHQGFVEGQQLAGIQSSG